MNSIFQRANPAILQLFEKAGSPKKVMCIPIDYAKKQHTALVCNGEGTLLRAPFHIHNNLAGIAYSSNGAMPPQFSKLSPKAHRLKNGASP